MSPAPAHPRTTQVICNEDQLRSLLANPHIGVLFFMPGVTDMVRVNGRATLSDDTELPAPSPIQGEAFDAEQNYRERNERHRSRVGLY
jgi:hypothetical protein